MRNPDLGDQPAFPTLASGYDVPASGMTLRQHYVGQALSGIIASYAGFPADKSLALVAQVGGPEAFAAIVGKAALTYANAAIQALENFNATPS